MPDVAPVADSTKFCADWRQAYEEKCQAANVTCQAVPDDYCPLSNWHPTTPRPIFFSLSSFPEINNKHN